ncbi:MAG: DUF4082 domain-containing protein [Planctomycetes bacterium]|nr:DUF4082 domain-containing protein [Planctomycetota bacterium]
MLVLVGLADADIREALVFSGDNYGFANSFSNTNIGFKFQTNEVISVQALGFYDFGQDGLGESHGVAVYDNTGALLVQGTVSPSDSLDGLFRYTSSITPIDLAADKVYHLIGYANSSADKVAGIFSGVTVDSAISFKGNLASSGGPLRFIDSGYGTGYDYGWFGPNMKIGAPIPEPISGVFLLMGSAVLLRGKSRKKNVV